MEYYQNVLKCVNKISAKKRERGLVLLSKNLKAKNLGTGKCIRKFIFSRNSANFLAAGIKLFASGANSIINNRGGITFYLTF